MFILKHWHNVHLPYSTQWRTCNSHWQWNQTTPRYSKSSHGHSINDKQAIRPSPPQSQKSWKLTHLSALICLRFRSLLTQNPTNLCSYLSLFPYSSLPFFCRSWSVSKILWRLSGRSGRGRTTGEVNSGPENCSVHDMWGLVWLCVYASRFAVFYA